MKRASDVPPLVESAGLRPVTSSTALATRSVKAPRLVRNATALVGSKLSATRAPPAAAATRRSISALRVCGVHRSLKRMLKTRRTSPGMTLVAGLPTSTLTTSRLEASKSGVPAIEGRRLQGGQNRRQRADRIVGEMGIGDMALLAGNDQPSGQRAAPAVLDGVAERGDAGRFAEQAMIEALASRSRPVQQFDRAVDGGPLLVAGDEKADRALESAARDEAQRGGQGGGEPALHVAGAASPDLAVRESAGEGIEAPFAPHRPPARRRYGRRRRSSAPARRSARRDCRSSASPAPRTRRSRRRIRPSASRPFR